MIETIKYSISLKHKYTQVQLIAISLKVKHKKSNNNIIPLSTENHLKLGVGL